MAIKKLEPEPRKTGINNDMVAILISCDPKGNHLQAASRGKISAKAINPVLKDKPEAQTVLCKNRHRSFEAFSKENKLAHQTVKISAKQTKKEYTMPNTSIKQHKKKIG